MKNINHEIKNCTKCPLNLLVPDCCSPITGIGNKKADVMIVTDCPREDEIILSEPISVIKQQFLSKIIDLDKVYITSLIKCNPLTKNGKNRNPNKNETKQCSNWLEQEIDIVNPKIIFCLGSSTVNYFLKDNIVLENVVLKEYTIGTRIIIPSYSISTLLNKSAKEVAAFKAKLEVYV